MVNKTKTATVEGLNQFFRVKKTTDKRTGVDVLVDNVSQMGTPLLWEEDLSELVSNIHNNIYKYYENLNFLEAITLLSDIRINNYYPNWPTSFSVCKKCEFKKDTTKDGIKKHSGFDHCFKTQYQWTDEDFKKPNIFNVWDLRGSKLMEQGLLFKEQLTLADIKYKEVAGHMSRTERQWIQIEKERDNDFTEFVDVEGLRAEINSWTFPLHFIDFETSTVPLPFHIGRKPYEEIAFQFSHHIYYEGGRIEHATEYINTTPGEFPNFKLTQHLHDALAHDNGTIFRFSNHENTILNAIHTQLKDSNHTFKEVLLPFVESISIPTDNQMNPWPTPERNMVDLCDVIKKYYYNPHTFGSNSIKKVLPAILKASQPIQDKYCKSIGEIGLSSRNFPVNHVWLKKENGTVVSPYKMLPKLFEGFSQYEIENYVSEMENIDDGGAALTAYGKIQYTNMTEEERTEISDALKRYCELDTLAMVMIYDHLKTLG